MLYRAAVIGDSQTVMGFKAVGLTTVAVSEEKEAARQDVYKRQVYLSLCRLRHANSGILSAFIP